MTDFITAFKEGMQAAQAADRAKNEVEDVFVELNKQLREISNGKLHIILIDAGKHQRVSENIIVVLNTVLPRFVIAAYNPSIPNSKNAPIELAQWSQDPNGYPCRITWANKTIACEDREALEDVLADLLRDTIVADKLSKLMNMTPPQRKKAHQAKA